MTSSNVRAIPLKLAYSPCPNDNFLFYFLSQSRGTSKAQAEGNQGQSEIEPSGVSAFSAQGQTPFNTAPYEFQIEHHDIENLNRIAFSAAANQIDLVKMSFTTYFQVEDQFDLLQVGSAFGEGVGPLIVIRPDAPGDTRSWRVGLPGANTTAALLTQSAHPEWEHYHYHHFAELISMLLNKQLEAAVIIHESRFVVEKMGLSIWQDLGRWWVEKTQLPLPLGALGLRKKWSLADRRAIEKLILLSLDFALAQPTETLPELTRFAQEQDPQVLLAHIHLYINSHTREHSPIAMQAIDKLRKLYNSWVPPAVGG